MKTTELYKILLEIDSRDGITIVKNTGVRALKVAARLVVHDGDIYAVALEFPELTLDQIRACYQWSRSNSSSPIPSDKKAS